MAFGQKIYKMYTSTNAETLANRVNRASGYLISGTVSASTVPGTNSVKIFNLRTKTDKSWIESEVDIINRY